MPIIVSPVRKAEHQDEEELMSLCRELHKENGLFGLNENKVRETLKRAFDQQGAIIGALGPPGKIEGAIFMLISNFWYSDEWHLEELFSFVLPQYRRSTNAVDLITFAKRCSDELGIPLVIGVISNERTVAKIGLYKRQFAAPTGAFFFYPKKELAKTA